MLQISVMSDNDINTIIVRYFLHLALYIHTIAGIWICFFHVSLVYSNCFHIKSMLIAAHSWYPVIKVQVVAFNCVLLRTHHIVSFRMKLLCVFWVLSVGYYVVSKAKTDGHLNYLGQKLLNCAFCLHTHPTDMWQMIFWNKNSQNNTQPLGCVGRISHSKQRALCFTSTYLTPKVTWSLLEICSISY